MQDIHQSIGRLPLADLQTFVVVVETGGFRRSADRLGLDPSTVSHTIKSLESKLGVRLFNRTTRSVAPTAAGQRLYDEVRPAFSAFVTALERLNDVRETPVGHLRIASSYSSYIAVVRPQLRSFSVAYPLITLEISISEGFIELVRDGFDVGIRLGQSIEQDMIAVRATPDLSHVVVGSPSYLEANGRPLTPSDLGNHRCIEYRHVSAQRLAAWHFAKDGESLEVKVRGPLIYDTPPLMLDAALDGLGLASVLSPVAEPYLRSGALIGVLGDWCPPISGFHLYYPSRRHMSAALRAFIDMVGV